MGWGGQGQAERGQWGERGHVILSTIKNFFKRVWKQKWLTR